MAKAIVTIVLLTSNITDAGEFRDSGWEMEVGKDLNEDRARCLIEEGRAYDKDNPPASISGQVASADETAKSKKKKSTKVSPDSAAASPPNDPADAGNDTADAGAAVGDDANNTGEADT